MDGAELVLLQSKHICVECLPISSHDDMRKAIAIPFNFKTIEVIHGLGC